MRAHDRWLVAGCTAALMLFTGAPAAAQPPPTAPPAWPGATGPAGLRELPLRGGQYPPFVEDMNSRGEIVGMYWEGDGREAIGIWRPPYDRPVPIGYTGAGLRQGNMINERGDVLSNEWYWHWGTWQGIASPGRWVFTNDLNDRGQVVGRVEDPATRDVTGFVWQDGQFTEIRSSDGDIEARLINNHGEVVGVLNRSAAGDTPFIWRRGVLRLIDAPEIVGAWPMDLNERGQVLFNAGHPYVWYRGRLTDLLAGQPKQQGRAMDLNDRGDVVGAVGYRPVLWRNGRTIALPLPAGAGWTGSAQVINENGDIGGLVTYTSGASRRYYVALWRSGRIMLFPLFRDADEGIDAHFAGITTNGWLAGRFSNMMMTRAAIWYPIWRLP